jgi:hypothetical protein
MGEAGRNRAVEMFSLGKDDGLVAGALQSACELVHRLAYSADAAAGSAAADFSGRERSAYIGIHHHSMRHGTRVLVREMPTRI